ncbi:MAG: DnaJ domain-containing protein [Raoultibacter sp.]
MTRDEALRILGLDEDATEADIKTAYKETVQILHPDRFATNKKLQVRATEQFKNLQGAYDYLTTGKGATTTQSSRARAGAYSPSNEVEARLAGIAAARTQLVAQRDVLADERRNGLLLAGIGLLIAAIARRIPIAIALGTGAILWGVIQAITSHTTVRTLDEHLTALAAERKQLLAQLDDE